ncbi:MAG: 2TM domain-containing protein, partial [Actinomycetota bacterium]
SGPPVRHRPPRDDDSTGKVAGTFAVISVFLILIWLLAGAGYFWPIWPMLGFGLVIGLKAVNSAR